MVPIGSFAALAWIIHAAAGLCERPTCVATGCDAGFDAHRAVLLAQGWL
jgi:hypothetical protein